MREIKFRIYDLQSKIMSDHFTLDDYASDHDYEDGYFRYQLRNNDKPYNDNIIMQFTGLHDKNGKEIYEGDIVRFYIEDVHDIQGIGYVVFRTGCFTVTAEKDYFPCLDSVSQKHITVIGNIYENPELAGGTQKGLDSEG
jgi:uncharacterized phage protein (TIGR01671 family)